MCGIAGSVRDLLGDDPVQILRAMNDVMLHRGPDMGEIYCDDSFGFCHRRLSIIDLSEDGCQPMQSKDGRYVIVFNGEIYNFLELRQELQRRGHQFRTKTDTEVLLQAFIEYGPASLDKINGMFAYAIWDSLEKKLFIARDRIGKKPLYYYYHQGNLAFASEIKSLLKIPAVRHEIDITALADYFKYLFIPHPKSIYQDIFKLNPGHYLLYSEGQLQIREYWDIDFSQRNLNSPEKIGEELYYIVQEAVKCRLLSDVPLGAFLSGGIDSSAIVALMCQASNSPITTCTIGFKDETLNEARYAKKFAKSLKANHYEHYIDDQPARIIKKLVWHFDEPFADSSMVPTYYVSKMARKNVTVALSGDGGDENFAGYSKYCIDKFENSIRRYMPSFLLQALSALSQVFLWNTVFRKIHSLSTTALLKPYQGFYVTNSFVTDCQLERLLNQDVRMKLDGYNPADHLTNYYQKSSGVDHLSKILYTDLKLLLPGDFLVKVDRMSMANSLEVRSPLLDYKLIEFAATIPSHYKLHGRQKKYIFKKSLSRVLPHEILTRKKQGFESPINRWFRQDLKSIAAHSLFQNETLCQFLEIKEIQKIWDQHQSGKYQHGTLLWTLFMFALWCEQIMEN